MPFENEDDLIEVFFQESADSEPDTDIVFSVVEAEEAVLDFYNEKIRQQLPGHALLQNYPQLMDFKKQSPHLIEGSAWFRYPQEVQSNEIRPEAASEQQIEALSACSFLIAEMHFQVDDFITDFHHHFLHILEQQGIGIEPDRLQHLIGEALWHVLSEDTEQSKVAEEVASLVEGSKTPGKTKVLLILIADDDIAVYMDDEYIDSASQDNDEEVEVIVDTANILADKFKTQVTTHYFKQMIHNWSWTHVETILKTLNIMPSRKNNLLHDLQLAGLIRVGNQVATSFELDNDALIYYSETGDDSVEALKIRFGSKQQQREIHLTLNEIVYASEIGDHVWICDDLSATELTVLPRKLMSVDTGRLLR